MDHSTRGSLLQSRTKPRYYSIQSAGLMAVEVEKMEIQDGGE